VRAEDLARLSPYWRDALAGAPRLSVWPPVLTPYHSQLVAGLVHLEASQWLPPDQLRRGQLAQAGSLVRHAAQHSPWFGRALAEAGVDPALPLTEAAWRRIPILHRRDVQRAGASLQCKKLPPHHGEVSWTQTSGSTGEPVRVSATAVTRLFQALFALRDHAWWERDLGGRLAAIRYTGGKAPGPRGATAPTWGGADEGLVKTGRFAVLDIDTDVPVQARWLAEFDPEYLLTYPTNLAALLDHGLSLPSLEGVRTVGEIVSPELRHRCKERWGVPIADIYTTQELGYVAIQCPRSEHLHVQSENVLVEVLDDTGAPCPPGVVGRLVITALQNFSTPLVRYDTGDLGALGPPCDCGRGLPVLLEVVGRTRQMVTLPSGETRWPLVGYALFRDVAPAVRQYQIIQESLTDLTARFAVDAPLTPAEEARLAEVIRGALRHPFAIRFEYLPSIPREKGGKYFEFLSRVIK
jgi:phenylacetate-CoA ligase